MKYCVKCRKNPAAVCRTCARKLRIELEGGNPLLSVLLAAQRELGKRGWDKTASGWLHLDTGVFETMEEALQLESDAFNKRRKEDERKETHE